MALILPFSLLPLLFMKNETVIGIIGKTQGVKIAASPPKNARKKKPQSVAFDPVISFSIGVSFLFSIGFTTFTASTSCFSTGISTFATTSSFPTLNENSNSAGGIHFVSSQLIKSTEPFISFVPEERSFTFCLNIALFAKYFSFISKFGSNSSIASLSVTLPTNSTSFVSKNLKVVAGGVMGISCEYKCHFGSIEAVKIKSNSLSEIFSVENRHVTGSRI